MFVNAKVDTRKFNFAMTMMAKKLGIDFKDVLKQQGKLLAQDLMKNSFPRTKQQGVDAVKRDLKNAVTPVTTDDIKNADADALIFQSKSLKNLIRKRDFTRFNEYLNRSNQFKGWKVVPFDTMLHLSKRNKYGRVRKEQKVMTFDYKEWLKYRTQLVKRVGWMAAGWAKDFRFLGGQKVPPWISGNGKILSARGKVVDQTTSRNPSLAVSNLTKGIQRYATTYSWAINMREKKIWKHIRHVLRARTQEAQNTR